MAISFDAKKNFAFSLVATAPSPAISGTSLVVTGGEGALFPATPFNAVVWPSGVVPTAATAEVVRVTNIATNTFTITRAQEGSTARTILVGDQIALNVTAKTLTDIQTAIATASLLAMPIGGGCFWFTDTVPTSFIFCRGQAISRSTYSVLFALWGTTYGVGDGSTTFNVPNLEQRIPIGKTTAGALSTLGTVTGSWDHSHGPGTLAVASHTHGPGSLTVASHTHDSGTLVVASHTHNAGTLSADSDGAHTHTGTTDAGGDHTHATPYTDGPADTNLDISSDVFIQTTVAITEGSGTHTHTFTTGSGGSHTHSVSGTTSSTSPAINGGDTGSTAPTVNSGVTAATAPVISGGSTASANPPVFVLNYIVRATNEV
jgi:microcystin-dependent protein